MTLLVRPLVLLSFFLLSILSRAQSSSNRKGQRRAADKDAFIEELISKMEIQDLVLQLHLTFADNIIGPASDNSLYDHEMRFTPNVSVGNVHDWYPLNTSRYNNLQRLNIEKSRLGIPFLHYGECLHGVGSFNQSMFPQTIGLSASFDTDLIHRVGRAIGSEARSIGVHACLSPVLDLAKDPRWGRAQEDWGEDKILTSHMGVAYASGLSKNGSWSDADAIAPVMKHFAAHGSPQSGINGAPFMGHGNREVLEEMLVPFKAVVDLGGVRGVMMAYSELDDVPSHVSPILYQALEDWGFDGFITADDTGMKQLQTSHRVAGSPADAIAQWFNAGGMIQYYDYPLETYLNATVGLVANGTVTLSTLRSKVRRIMGVKYDLGLFDDPYIPSSIDPYALTDRHAPLTLEAAQKSIVLLENRNSTLPLDPQSPGKKIALVGPFGDVLNYGDYSGQYGSYPTTHSSTIRQGILAHISSANSSWSLNTTMGTNTWLFNGQYPIPGYYLSSNGTNGGLLATYYGDTNFTKSQKQTFEVPTGTWGLYPPPGLSSNNFSVIWEGELQAGVDILTEGWLGIAVGPNTTARLFVDGVLHTSISETREGNILSNIPSQAYSIANASAPPPGSSPFLFQPEKTHHIRIEYQTWNLYQKIENESSLNSLVFLFWNLVSPTSALSSAVSVARAADIIVLAVGAAWDSDGEGGDRATLGLSTNQTTLANAIFGLGKPVIMILQGGRPFAIPEFYSRADAVLSAFFPGQGGGQAIADVIFGTMSPGGRLPISVPRHVGQLPVYYNYKPTGVQDSWVDMMEGPQYPFGYGLTYTTFNITGFGGSGDPRGNATSTFTDGDTIIFSATLTNSGTCASSYVLQVYLLGRVSQITQPVKQLVAFQRAYLEAGESRYVEMELDVNRYLKILDRGYKWVLEKGDYTFAMLENGGNLADTSMNITMTAV